jgi:hypothetical protein
MQMIDLAYDIRQQFIRNSDPLEVKRQALREEMHKRGIALIGEETLAAKNGWKRFDYQPSTQQEQK